MRATGMHFVGTFALAAVLALAAGCDADRDAQATTAEPEVDAPAPPPATPDPAEASIPPRFQGSYAADAGACDTTGHASHLDIGDDAIAFHESSGPVTAVASGPADLAVTARLTGEGETREATYRFRLSDDGATLTDLGAGMQRVRCD